MLGHVIRRGFLRRELIHVDNSLDEARAREILRQAEIQERYLSQKNPAARQRAEEAFINHLQQHNLDDLGGTSTILNSFGSDGELAVSSSKKPTVLFLFSEGGYDAYERAIHPGLTAATNPKANNPEGTIRFTDDSIVIDPRPWVSAKRSKNY